MSASLQRPNGLALYRKHRPQVLAGVLGQDHVVTVLGGALREGKIAHAYLFAGPRGTGKTTVARILAKRLNCEFPRETEPCGTCAHCIAVQQTASLDLIEIDAASHRGIDEIRALKERIGLAPTAGKYKVYIVDEVHMLTKEAFNALLKTLEEPPAHAVFVLATTELHKVPETIRSRCQTFLFRRAPVDLLTRRLEAIAQAEGATISPDALQLIAHHSEGCFRDAESLLGQVLAFQRGSLTLENVEQLLGMTGMETIQAFVGHLLVKDAHRALELLQSVSDHGASLREFVDDVTRYLRALAAFSVVGTHSESFAPSVEEALHVHAEHGDTRTFLVLLRVFLRAKTEMRDAMVEELPVELAILEWCNGDARSGGAPPGGGEMNPARTREERRSPPQEVPEQRAHGERDNEHTERGRETPNPALFESVRAVWRSFLEESARLNPLLLSTLEACTPVAIRDRTLYLVTATALYQDRISEQGVRMPLEDLLTSLLGERILLRVVHQREAASLGLPEPQTLQTLHGASTLPRQGAPEQRVNLTADALSLFGGEIVGSGGTAGGTP